MTEKQYTGGDQILRALDFYRGVVAEINEKTDEEIESFSIIGAIESRIAGMAEQDALNLLDDLYLLVSSLDVFGLAFAQVGKAKYQKGASNVS